MGPVKPICSGSRVHTATPALAVTAPRARCHGWFFFPYPHPSKNPRSLFFGRLTRSNLPIRVSQSVFLPDKQVCKPPFPSLLSPKSGLRDKGVCAAPFTEFPTALARGDARPHELQAQGPRPRAKPPFLSRPSLPQAQGRPPQDTPLLGGGLTRQGPGRGQGTPSPQRVKPAPDSLRRPPGGGVTQTSGSPTGGGLRSPNTPGGLHRSESTWSFNRFKNIGRRRMPGHHEQITNKTKAIPVH